jgi:hypothetical protein
MPEDHNLNGSVLCIFLYWKQNWYLYWNNTQPYITCRISWGTIFQTVQHTRCNTMLYYFIFNVSSLHEIAIFFNRIKTCAFCVFSSPSSFCEPKYFVMLITGWPPLWFSGQSSWLQIQKSRIRFSALLDFLKSSGSGTGSTQTREDNWGATRMEK